MCKLLEALSLRVVSECGAWLCQVCGRQGFVGVLVMISFDR